MKRRRHRRIGPAQQVQAASGLLLTGALVSGCGAYYRLSSRAGGPANLGYLAETLGLFLAVAGAVWLTKAADMLVVFEPMRVRSRAILFLLAGIGTTLIACVAASVIQAGRHNAGFRAVVDGAIVGGIGLGLAGFLMLLWAFGLRYAGERIERLSEEDW